MAGSSKAAEGHLDHVLWAEAKDEGVKVPVNWKDGDSSSAKGFRHSFPNANASNVMLCGHVGRVYSKKLQEMQYESSFSQGFVAL